jgi:hypothetical protein
MTTERDMLDRLNARYASAPPTGIRYARAEHVKLSTGYDARGICDYMVLDTWNQGYGADAGPKLHGFEVKVSRSDWLHELRQPEKAEQFARYCDFWWLVVPDDKMVRLTELPPGWGLLANRGRGLQAVVPAIRRTPEPMPRSLQATLARSIVKTTHRLTVERPDDTALRRLNQTMADRPRNELVANRIAHQFARDLARDGICAACGLPGGDYLHHDLKG